MDFYQFGTYCQVRYMQGGSPTEKMLVHFYKHVEAARWMKNDKLKFAILAPTAKYIFTREYPQPYDDMLRQKQIEIKLFEDNPPQIQALETLLPEIYSQ